MSDLVGNPEDRFSNVAAQLLVFILKINSSISSTLYFTLKCFERSEKQNVKTRPS